MKKNLAKFFACLSVLCMTIVGTYALSNYDSCVILLGQSSAETDSVGTSKECQIWAQTYSDSKSKMKVNLYAAWTGWPYTLEFSTEVVPKNTMKHVETQSRNSNFYGKLITMGDNDTHGTCQVKAL